MYKIWMCGRKDDGIQNQFVDCDDKWSEKQFCRKTTILIQFLFQMKRGLLEPTLEMFIIYAECTRTTFYNHLPIPNSLIC